MCYGNFDDAAEYVITIPITNLWVMIAETMAGSSEAKNSWLSGTSAWNYVAITQ